LPLGGKSRTCAILRNACAVNAFAHRLPALATLGGRRLVPSLDLPRNNRGIFFEDNCLGAYVLNETRVFIPVVTLNNALINAGRDRLFIELGNVQADGTLIAEFTVETIGTLKSASAVIGADCRGSNRASPGPKPDALPLSQVGGWNV
jgi:hypothetical protein